MRTRIKQFIWISAALLAGGAATLAADVGAVISGNWNSTTTWTPAVIPDATSAVYIGSLTPAGSARAATVTLTQDQSANNVYLGWAAGPGQLNLGNSRLTINDSFVIGDFAGQGVVQRGSGSFTVPNLTIIGGNDLTFGAQDAVTNLVARGSATTAATGNVTNSAFVADGGRLTLGANMSLTGDMTVTANGTLDMAGHTLDADAISLGAFGASPGSLINDGTIRSNSFSLFNGGTVTLHGVNDVISNQIALSNHSILTVLQASGQSTGLTLNGTSPGSLSLLDTSALSLVLGQNSQPNWIFRWQDPLGGGNWVSTLTDLINAGRISVDAPNGYSLVDQGGYTYVEGEMTPVPEPTSLVLVGVGGVALIARALHRRRWAGR